jgi:hypothetical protein
MAVVYTKKDQGNSVTSGTGAPVHTAVAGDRYTDTATGDTYQYTNAWRIVSLGGYGIWGIANASGLYTYYATYQLAVASAVAGQTIEMFGSQTESTANHILKNGVNINYNGYTLTFGGLFRLDDNNVACDVQLLNGEIKQPTTDGYCIKVLNAGTIIRGNVLVNSSGTNSLGLYGPATVIGLNFKGSFCLTLYSAPINGKAYGVTVNCTSNQAVAYCEIHNSVVNSTSTNGNSFYRVTLINNCSGVMNGSRGFYMQGTSIKNSSFTNLTSEMFEFATQDDNFIDSCYFRASASNIGRGNGQGKGLISNSTLSGVYYLWRFDGYIMNMNNCTLISDGSHIFYFSYGATFNFCNFILRDSSNAFQDLISGTIKLNNCNFQLFNASAYPVYAGSAKNFTASNNTYNTTNFQLNMTNLQTFTADAYGNQRLN